MATITQAHSQAPSKLNYVTPAVALATWTAFWIVGGIWLDYQVHNYHYPKNPINPDLVERMGDAAAALLGVSVATIPAAFAATLIRGVVNGGLECGNGLSSAWGKCKEVLKESCSPNKFLEREGIIINTAAAPFAVLVGIFYSLQR